FYLGNPISLIPVFLIPSMCELGSGRRGDLMTPKAFAIMNSSRPPVSSFRSLPDKQIWGNLRNRADGIGEIEGKAVRWRRASWETSEFQSADGSDFRHS